MTSPMRLTEAEQVKARAEAAIAAVGEEDAQLAKSFELTRLTLRAAKAVAQEVLGKADPEHTLAVLNKTLEVWHALRKPTPGDDPPDRDEATFG